MHSTAYARRYHVQVSPDGRRWRTAATVRDGAGGRETVRLDAPADWSVEVYAVREPRRDKGGGGGRDEGGGTR